jgi:phosphatidylinositol kinase/protein kinase (PI-3  family)
MCSSRCKEKLNLFDVLELLKIPNEEMKKYIYDIILNAAKNDIKNIIYCLDILLNNLKYNHYIGKALILLSTKSEKLIFVLFWKFNIINSDPIINNIYIEWLNNTKQHNKDYIVKLETQKEFMELLKDKNLNKNDLNNYISNKNLYIFDELIVKIAKIKTFKSANKPLKISFVTKNQKIIDILYKNDDLRKDELIMNIIKVSEYLLGEHDMNCNIIKFDVIPIENSIGIIRLIPNAKTILEIKKEGFNIQNYIIENNKNMQLKTIRNKYIRSMAFYSVMTYILGIGDRHLDNIMIKNTGELFHIDFEYILDKKPKFIEPEIRITNEMLDTLGGKNSKDYKSFVNISTKIFNILRKYTNLFSVLLSPLYESNPKISNFTTDDITKQIKKRMMPGSTNKEASRNLKIKICNKSQYSQDLYDVINYYNKGSPFQSSLSGIMSFFQLS